MFYYAETENGTYTTAVPVHAGTYWVKAVVEATTNNEASSSEAKQFTIARAANGWLDGQDTYSRDGWTYGQAPAQVTAPEANFGSASVVYTFGGEAYEDEFTSASPAGTYTATVTVAETDNWAGLHEEYTFTVGKATLTLTADDESVVYGESVDAVELFGHLLAVVNVSF